MTTNIKMIKILAMKDVDDLEKSEKSYGDSWRKYDGISAVMNLARKWDRIENQSKNKKYDLFEAIKEDMSDEGILDDIRDLRRYCLLIESYMLEHHYKK